MKAKLYAFVAQVLPAAQKAAIALQPHALYMGAAFAAGVLVGLLI